MSVRCGRHVLAISDKDIAVIGGKIIPGEKCDHRNGPVIADIKPVARRDEAYLEKQGITANELASKVYRLIEEERRIVAKEAKKVRTPHFYSEKNCVQMMDEGRIELDAVVRRLFKLSRPRPIGSVGQRDLQLPSYKEWIGIDFMKAIPHDPYRAIRRRQQARVAMAGQTFLVSEVRWAGNETPCPFGLHYDAHTYSG